MSFFASQRQAIALKSAIFAAAFLMTASQGSAERGGGSPFQGLSGYWSGGGTVTLRNGSTERIRCKATYAVSSTGAALNQSLRCASDSYKLDISSNIIFQGGGISGTWSETNHNVSGTVSGRASSGEISAAVGGGAFTASLSVRTHGNRQSVSIIPHGGTDVASVAVSLSRG